jgi:hypothetical protein
MTSAAARPSAASTFCRPAKFPLTGGDHLRTEARGAELRLGPRQFERVDVEPDQPSPGAHAFQDRPGMTTAAERAVDRDLARFGPKAQQDLSHHDRQVHTGRRLAGREDFLHIRRVALGVQLFVLVVEGARVAPRIARAAPVPGVHVVRHGRSCYHPARRSPAGNGRLRGLPERDKIRVAGAANAHSVSR